MSFLHYYPISRDMLSFFDFIRNLAASNYNHFQYATRSAPADFVRLDQDILSPLAGKKQLYTYENKDFWEQIKTPG